MISNPHFQKVVTLCKMWIETDWETQYLIENSINTTDEDVTAKNNTISQFQHWICWFCAVFLNEIMVFNIL